MANWGTKSRHERNYGYAWEKLRKKVIERDKGLCQPCLKANRITRFQAVDHITSRARAKQLGWPESRTESVDNCQCICDDCHSKKTEEEQGKTKHAPKPRIGADGWPIP